MMKIAFLTPEYPHALTGSSGGIGTSIHNLAIGLVQQGHTVRVLVYGQKADAVFEDNGITIQQIQNIKFKGLSWWLTRKKIERIITQLHAATKIDLVEAPDWTGITSFITPKNCPVVIRLNGSDTYFCHLEQRPVKFINKFHEKRALQKANGLLAVSQFTADVTNAVFGLQKQFTIIPNGIDVAFFKSNGNSNGKFKSNVNDNDNDNFNGNDNDKFKSNGNDNDNFNGNGNEINGRFSISDKNTLLYFGTLIRKKGSLELPLIFNEVYKRAPQAKLIIIGRDASDIITGNTSTWQMMQQLFDKDALNNVTYLGSVAYDSVRQHIHSAAVCIFPSFAEALPVSWIEAMAMEKAIVASNIGWATEVIDDSLNGFLEFPKSPHDFAQKIVLLLENETLRQQFGSAARKKVTEKFSIAVVAQQSADFYNNLLQ